MLPCAVSSPACWGTAVCHTSLLVLQVCWGCPGQECLPGEELVDSCPLQALVVGLKACSTWENTRCQQDCRECTGGMVGPRPRFRRPPCLSTQWAAPCARQNPRLPLWLWAPHSALSVHAPSPSAAGPIRTMSVEGSAAVPGPRSLWKMPLNVVVVVWTVWPKASEDQGSKLHLSVLVPWEETRNRPQEFLAWEGGTPDVPSI